MASTGIPGTVFWISILFYCIACGLQGVPVTQSYNMTLKLIHCIKVSLYATRLAYLRVNFTFLLIYSNYTRFPIFICCRTVETCTPY